MMMSEYMAGTPKREVAKKYGVNVKTVQAHAHRARSLDDGGVGDDVLADYAGGVPVGVLAGRCGVPVEQIAKQARLAGVRAGAPQVDADGVDQIVRLYEQGMGMAGIGGQVGLSFQRVRQVLSAAGAEIRPRGRQTLAA